ncbi:unnamed protein product [Coffea canephora]|uniref:50S ribosomal protein L18, chloroplastic n=1 Tax=Coffea canephora TaxID=49390 RepID=A0A068V7R4_COFCA|nr:unnamed protein product [Coffea canephora]
MAAMGALISGLQQLQLKTCQLFGTSDLHHFDNILPKKRASLKPLVIEAKANAKTESAKTRNIRLRKKAYSASFIFDAILICGITCLVFLLFHLSLQIMVLASLDQFNGTATKPRLSVFCSDKQLYAMVVDDQNKRCLFYGSTLQKSIRQDLSCTTIEAAQRVGEELVKVCIDLDINEISSYDRNGLARGDRMQAFEIAISRHGFLPR